MGFFGGQLLGQHQDAHGNHEPAERFTQDIRGKVAGEPGTRKAAGDRGGGHGQRETPGDRYGLQVPGEPGG
ncbi:hypothetical protein L3i22_043800 [Actinoplanes sp. L3-i22]|nr:hypothetical protein L3i22_043800 [Actinoplanes sp. L3-i22]